MASSIPKIHAASYIDLPIEVCEQSNGFAFDFGGSVLKVVYRPKEKKVLNGEPEVAEGRERIRFMSFARTEWEVSLEEIASVADIRRSDEKEVPMINSTGYGSSVFKDKIQDFFNIKTRNINEMDCFIKSFYQLSKLLSREELVDPLHEEGRRAGEKEVDSFLKVMDNFESHSEASYGFKKHSPSENETAHTKDVPLADGTEDMYPCFLMMMGSAFGLLKIEADGKGVPVEGSGRGGRSFLGLGHLLTGENKYEDLIRLAEAGDDRNVNVYSDDLKLESKEKDDPYANVPSDLLVFNFGKAMTEGAEHFRKEDLARTLVVHYATDITQFAHLSAAVAGVNHVFFCGNFANADVMRRELSKLIVIRSIYPISKKPVQFHFLRHGGYLGALGAFITR